eukprot:COSAG02_NODE_138_length_34440_cov_16.694368_15_plen_122_part_00
MRRLGRCRAEHRLAERLGGGDGAAEAKQERYAALPLPSPPPRALDRLPEGIAADQVKSVLTYMEEFTLGELGVFLGAVGGIMTSVLLAIQKSKCKNIKCCGCECDRDPTLTSDDGVESTQP